jgi:hypothetical protein
MHGKRKTGFILEAVFVLVIMAALSSIAVPEITEMISEEQPELRAGELGDIQTAVTDMLADSQTKTLQPIGPTRDMGLVQTTDIPPLVLTDYLDNPDMLLAESDCNYSFTADGRVIQDCP